VLVEEVPTEQVVVLVVVFQMPLELQEKVVDHFIIFLVAVAVAAVHHQRLLLEE
tara:strand:+ start:333 stop:494 length:162 start_codon:yes stop_codon:yes gene_type:complete